MRVVETDLESSVEAETNVSASSSSSSEQMLSHKSYHEMSDITLVESDLISQLASNIELLSDLQSRLSFLMRETRYLMKA